MLLGNPVLSTVEGNQPATGSGTVAHPFGRSEIPGRAEAPLCPISRADARGRTACSHLLRRRRLTAIREAPQYHGQRYGRQCQEELLRLALTDVSHCAHVFAPTRPRVHGKPDRIIPGVLRPIIRVSAAARSRRTRSAT